MAGDLTRRGMLRAVLGAGIAGGIADGATATDGRSAPEYDGWPMFGHDPGNSGNAPGEAAPSGEVTTRWTYETGAAVWSGPAVSGGTVYVGSNDDKVHAIDAATGEQE